MPMDNVEKPTKESVDNSGSWAGLSTELWRDGTAPARSSMVEDPFNTKFSIVSEDRSKGDHTSAPSGPDGTKSKQLSERDMSSQSATYANRDQTVVDQSTVGRDKSSSALSVVDGSQTVADHSGSGRDSSSTGANFVRGDQATVNRSTTGRDRTNNSVKVVDGNQTVVDESRTGRDSSNGGVNFVKGDQSVVDQSVTGRDRSNNTVNVVEGNQTIRSESVSGRDSFSAGLNIVRGDQSASQRPDTPEKRDSVKDANQSDGIQEKIEANRDIINHFMAGRKFNNAIAESDNRHRANEVAPKADGRVHEHGDDTNSSRSTNQISEKQVEAFRNFLAEFKRQTRIEGEGK